MQVALRFAAEVSRDAAAFLFHPDQTVTENEDGSLTVRFKAGGLDEMSWHLVTWQESVTVEKPLALRRPSGQAVRNLGSAPRRFRFQARQVGAKPAKVDRARAKTGHRALACTMSATLG